MMQLLGKKIYFEKNKKLLFTQYHDYFIVLFISALLDATSTYMFMFNLGIEEEQNPIIRFFALYLGISAGPFIGKTLQLFSVWVLSILAPRLTKFVCSITILINLFAFSVNCHAFFYSTSH